MKITSLSSNISNKPKYNQQISTFSNMPKVQTNNSKNIKSNILNDKNQLIKESENKIGINTFNNKEEKNYYCLKCDKIISFDKKGKEKHFHSCIFPWEEYFTKNDVSNIINFYKSLIQDLNIEIQKLKNEERINKEYQMKYIDEFCILKQKKPENIIELLNEIIISAQEKEENQIEYIDEILMNPLIRPHYEIQIVDQMEILKERSLDYEIEYTEDLEIRRESIIIPEKNQIKFKNDKKYIIERNSAFLLLANKKNRILELKHTFDMMIVGHEKYMISIIDKSDRIFIKNKNNMNDNSSDKDNKYLMEINELSKELRTKDKEIKELKKTFPFEINQGDKIMTVTFTTTDQKFFYSIICKNTEIFANLVFQLFKEYPDYKDKSVYFMCNGIVIKEYKTLDENKIKNRDIILLNFLSNNSSIQI